MIKLAPYEVHLSCMLVVAFWVISVCPSELLAGIVYIVFGVQNRNRKRLCCFSFAIVLGEIKQFAHGIVVHLIYTTEGILSSSVQLSKNLYVVALLCKHKDISSESNALPNSSIFFRLS